MDVQNHSWWARGGGQFSPPMAAASLIPPPPPPLYSTSTPLAASRLQPLTPPTPPLSFPLAVVEHAGHLMHLQREHFLLQHQRQQQQQHANQLGSVTTAMSSTSTPLSNRTSPANNTSTPGEPPMSKTNRYKKVSSHQLINFLLIFSNQLKEENGRYKDVRRNLTLTSFSNQNLSAGVI